MVVPRLKSWGERILGNNREKTNNYWCEGVDDPAIPRSYRPPLVFSPERETWRWGDLENEKRIEDGESLLSG